MQGSKPHSCYPGSPVSDPTSSLAAVVADTIVRTVELGVTITDATVDGEVTVVFCSLLDDGQRFCAGCGGEGRYRDTVVRAVTDVPVVGHPLRPRVGVPRYRCVNVGCEREVFAHNTARLARPGWSTTRRCARYICHRLMIDRATVAAVARELGLSWDTVNTIALDATQAIVANDTTRLDGVRVIGVDEHRWSHTRRRRGRLRHGHHRPHRGAGGHRAGAAARPGSRPLGGRTEDLAGRPACPLP